MGIAHHLLCSTMRLTLHPKLCPKASNELPVMGLLTRFCVCAFRCSLQLSRTLMSGCARSYCVCRCGFSLSVCPPRR